MAFQFSVTRMSDTENPVGAVNVPWNDGDVRARLDHCGSAAGWGISLTGYWEAGWYENVHWPVLSSIYGSEYWSLENENIKHSVILFAKTQTKLFLKVNIL